MELVSSDSEILRSRCNDLDLAQVDIEKLVHEMQQIMVAHDGIGLAAPQVGLDLRLFINNVDNDRVLINPTIIHQSDETCVMKEGCLSFPNLVIGIKRPKRITIQYTTMKGEAAEKTVDSLVARCFAHEVDHLNGILFMDRASNMSLRLATERFRHKFGRGWR